MRLQSISLVASLLFAAVHGSPHVTKRTTNLDNPVVGAELPYCTKAQTDVIRQTVDNVMAILNALVQTPGWTSDNPWYQTFFGTDAAAQGGFGEISGRFDIARRILRGSSDRVTFRCIPPKGDAKCAGAGAYVGLENVPAKRITFCPTFFVDSFEGDDSSALPSAFNGNKGFDCANHGGANAGKKTKEQVLLHELMHVGLITTKTGEGQWKEEDRIIDCYYGAFYTPKIPDYTNSFAVARVNADMKTKGHAFMVYFYYISRVCDEAADKPRFLAEPGPTDYLMSADRRCTLGPLRAGKKGHPNLTEE